MRTVSAVDGCVPCGVLLFCSLELTVCSLFPVSSCRRSAAPHIPEPLGLWKPYPVSQSRGAPGTSPARAARWRSRKSPGFGVKTVVRTRYRFQGLEPPQRTPGPVFSSASVSRCVPVPGRLRLSQHGCPAHSPPPCSPAASLLQTTLPSPSQSRPAKPCGRTASPSVPGHPCSWSLGPRVGERFLIVLLTIGESCF